ncbi:RNA polymerase sigma factor, sigma-70 family [Actinacidiphila alni]|uniref:RNA polymerase sigma factor, sigma-70 family n=1 Tax=Actinacidiphila alni TaxID=380248 RepID=A0A1I1XSN0_9ACTN|nr:RNA polymerase sigma factor, sigma-70 family [Actinacidiphila alni]
MRGAATYEEDAVVRAGARRRGRTDGGDLGRAVTRARAGDEAAFTVVYREVQPMLLGFLRGLVGDDADDIASDTWHDIVRDLHAFRGDGAAFRGWAATIARHRALDHIRRVKSRPRTTVLDPAAVEPVAVPDSAGTALENLSTARALAMIAELPRDQAEAVLLRVVIGLSGPAAADVLGKRPGAVRTAAYRGLRRLAQQLGGTARDMTRDADPSAVPAEDVRGDAARPGAVRQGGGLRRDDVASGAEPRGDDDGAADPSADADRETGADTEVDASKDADGDTDTDARGDGGLGRGGAGTVASDDAGES